MQDTTYVMIHCQILEEITSWHKQISVLWVVNGLGKDTRLVVKRHGSSLRVFFFPNLYYFGQVTKPSRINFHLLIYIVMLIILLFPNLNGLRSSFSILIGLWTPVFLPAHSSSLSIQCFLFSHKCNVCLMVGIHWTLWNGIEWCTQEGISKTLTRFIKHLTKRKEKKIQEGISRRRKVGGRGHKKT